MNVPAGTTQHLGKGGNDLTLDPESQYEFAYYWGTAQDYTSSACTLSISIAGINILQRTITETTVAYEYQKETISFTGVEDVTTIDIYIACSAQFGFSFDDFSIIKTSCDATQNSGSGDGSNQGSGTQTPATCVSLLDDSSVEEGAAQAANGLSGDFLWTVDSSGNPYRTDVAQATDKRAEHVRKDTTQNQAHAHTGVGYL